MMRPYIPYAHTSSLECAGASADPRSRPPLSASTAPTPSHCRSEPRASTRASAPNATISTARMAYGPSDCSTRTITEVAATDATTSAKAASRLMGTRTARTGATLTPCRKPARLRSVALIVSVVPDSERRGLLTDVRVLDLSIWRPGPYATQLLVELGADVVKVEPPGGDPMRVFPTLFAVLNAGKRAVAVDLKDAAGRAAVLERTASADVVVEGFRPGVVDRLGVGEDAVRAGNPSVVYCSVSGYGQDGPLRLLPGHDLNYQAWAGVVEPRPGDDTPVVGRPPIADLAGGCYAALAICAAVVRRLRRDEGERIDVSMTDILATWTGALPPLTLPDGRSLGELPGYGTFATADGGWIALGVLR